jgi:mono/diheme cytochrome c family protein
MLGLVAKQTDSLMNRTVICSIVLWLAAASPAAFGQGFAALSGAELFERFCSACHGTEGRGDGPVASSLAVLVPDLTRLYQRHGDRFPAAEVREIIDGRSIVIAHGTRYMPVWGYEFWVEEGADVVAEEDARIMIDRLVDYLRSIQYAMNPADPVP